MQDSRVPLEPGALLNGGRYQVEELVGSGSFSLIYRATDMVLGRPVAIKEALRQDFASEWKRNSAGRLVPWSPGKLAVRQLQEAKTAFESEARFLARFHSRHIVRVYDFFIESAPYLVLEYLPGQTLRERVERGGVLPAAEALQVLEGIASALGDIHAARWGHFDLNPNNVLLTGPGADDRLRGPERTVLLDFGLARECRSVDAHGTLRLDSAMARFGTPAYAAPEQHAGASVGQEADIYALGATLFFALSGRDPATATTLLSSASSRADAHDFPSLNAEAGAKMSALLNERLLSADRTRRGTVEEALREVEGLLSPLKSSAPRVDAKAPLVNPKKVDDLGYVPKLITASQHSNRVASAYGGNTDSVYLYGLAKGSMHSVTSHSPRVLISCLAVDSSGDRLIYGTSQYALTLTRNISSETWDQAYYGAGAQVVALDWSAFDPHAIVRTITGWELRALSQNSSTLEGKTLHAEKSFPRACAFSATGEVFLTHLSTSVALWRLEDGKVLPLPPVGACSLSASSESFHIADSGAQWAAIEGGKAFAYLLGRSPLGLSLWREVAVACQGTATSLCYTGDILRVGTDLGHIETWRSDGSGMEKTSSIAVCQSSIAQMCVCNHRVLAVASDGTVHALDVQFS